MKQDTIWNIILIISILLIFNGLIKTGNLDKKEAQIGQDQTTAGVTAMVISLIGKKMNPAILAPILGAGWPIVVGALSLLFLFPKFLGGIVDIFRPQPTIPTWIWIAVFIVLLFFVMGRRK